MDSPQSSKPMRLISAMHPRVVHYTTHDGLYGILESGRLWATHFKSLNDPTEFATFRSLLENKFKAVALELWRKGKTRLPTDDADLAEMAFSAIARNVADILHRSTFGPRSFGQPFVASFCSSKKPYVQENGLLSQWRGYGGGGGYAIEFETEVLERLLHKFAKRFALFGVFADVIYDENSQSYAEYLELIERFVQLVGPITRFLDWIKDTPPDVGSRALELLVQIASRLKHPAYSEEEEVRIAFVRIEQGAGLPLIPLRFDSLPDLKIARVELFADDGVVSAIRRIIVGPHARGEERAEALRLFLASRGLSISVQLSDIPYRQR